MLVHERQSTPSLEQGNKGEEQTTFLDRGKIWLVASPGTKSPPFPRHCAEMWSCGLTWSVFSDPFQDASFGASLVGCVANRILATVLKTTRNVLLLYPLSPIL